MPTIARWLRGALGIGVTWAALWMLVGVVLWAGFTLFQPGDIDPGEGLRRVLPILGFVGLLSGVGFATVLSLTERRRKLRELSLVRVALWGALGSAAIPLVMGAPAGEGWVASIFGAVFASASVAIARRGKETDTSLDGPDIRGLGAPDGLCDPLAASGRAAARPAI